MNNNSKTTKVIYNFVMTSLFVMVGCLYCLAPFKATGAIFENFAIESAVALNDDIAFEKEEVIALKGKEHLLRVLARHEYDLEDVAAGSSDVPRIYFTNFPKDFKTIRQKKDPFIQILLPIILKENERIMEDREKLLVLQEKDSRCEKLTKAQLQWIDDLASQYRLTNWDFESLLRRVDIIPVSLALGQAIVESGWGVSYAAINKNSPFGITIKDGVKRYEDLVESVHKYMRNLNYNNAYGKMRLTREKLRKNDEDIEGHTLVGDLYHYSIQRKVYINKVRAAITGNNLFAFDKAGLSPIAPVIQTAQTKDDSQKA